MYRFSIDNKRRIMNFLSVNKDFCPASLSKMKRNSKFGKMEVKVIKI